LIIFSAKMMTLDMVNAKSITTPLITYLLFFKGLYIPDSSG